MQLLHFILKVNNYCEKVSYLVLLDTICVNLPSEMLFKIQNVPGFTQTY